MTPTIGLTFQRDTQAFTLLDPRHTKWSHGPQSTPHAWARVAVLHQGCIDNHTSLRSQLEDRGYPFVSSSDGELIAHLIDAVNPGDARQAVRRAAGLLQGSFGLAVQLRDLPGRLLATCTGAPQALHFDGLSIRWAPPAEADPAQPGGDSNGTLFHLKAGDIIELQTSKGRTLVQALTAVPQLPQRLGRRQDTP
jgi:glucosamine--fructose-6-phosphate aminotransferase (isomerizing)